jgi:WD40 repeat protein
VAFSPDGKRLAAGGYGEVAVVDMAGAERVATLPGPEGSVTAVQFSPDGKWLAAAGGLPGKSGVIQLWDQGTKAGRVLTGAHTDAAYSLAWSPDSKTVATCSYDKMVSLWDMATGKHRILKDHTDAVYAVAFSPDGKQLASASGDRTVKVWDVASGKRLYTLGDSTAELYCVAFHPSGTEVAAAGVDKMLRKWTVGPTAGGLSRSAFAHDAPIIRVVYTADGDGLYTSSEDRSIKLWDAATLSEKKVFPRQPDWPLGLAVSPDEKRLAVSRYDGSLTLYDTTTGQPAMEPLRAAPKPVR